MSVCLPTVFMTTLRPVIIIKYTFFLRSTWYIFWPRVGNPMVSCCCYSRRLDIFVLIDETLFFVRLCASFWNTLSYNYMTGHLLLHLVGAWKVSFSFILFWIFKGYKWSLYRTNLGGRRRFIPGCNIFEGVKLFEHIVSYYV